MKAISYWLQFGRFFSKISYFIRAFGDYYLVPARLYLYHRERLFSSLSDDEKEAVCKRCAYYNGVQTPVRLKAGTLVRDYRFPYHKKKRFSQYFFDLYDTVKFFPKEYQFDYLFGDITYIPSQPTFVKSRPISIDNANSVIMKLDKFRHFYFISDKKLFSEKKDMIVCRTNWANANPLRKELFEKYYNHPICNVGKVVAEQNEQHPETVKGYMSIRRQLDYKFIACIEGHDVATSLKWVMSSNSVAVSPKMKYETWFMEGTLIPDYHYIEVKEDYSDMIDKLKYYIAHPDEAEAIIEQAHKYVSQFLNSKTEKLIQIAVAEKYFQYTNVHCHE